MKKIPMFLLMIAPYAFVKIFFDWGPSAALLLTYPSILLLNMVYPYICVCQVKSDAKGHPKS